MQYTENLGLPIIEGTDTMPALRSQGNGIANQLETVLGGLLDDIAAIPDIRSDISDINNDISALETRVELLEQLETKETVKIDGEDRVLTKVTAKLSATSTGNTSSVSFKGTDDDDDHRHTLVNTTASLIVDLTDTLGVSDETDILLKNAITYQNGYEYMASRNNSPFNIVALGKIPNDNNVKLIMGNNTPYLLRQTRSEVGGVEIWNPSARPPYEYNQEVIVVIEYFVLT